MRNLVIPCAGQSSRYTTDLPKWLLTLPNGNLMVYESIQGLPLDTFDLIIITALKRHLNDELRDKICQQFIEYENFLLLELEDDTQSASDTISTTIETLNLQGSLFIKDADDYFKVNEVNENEVCTISLNDCKNITPGNKSYIKKNDNGEVLTIVEKNVISSDFCCGLYTFDSCEEFVKTYKSINQESEIYISHVIFQMLLNGKTFKNRNATDFIDWGTQEDFDNFIKKYE